MLPKELEQYLHEHIPLSKAMSVSVLEALTTSVTLSAPLAPNINHRNTLFGGSASAIAILAAWSLLHTRLRAEGVSGRLVIQRNTMNYLLPIDGGFTAVSKAPTPEAWSAFMRMLTRKGKARTTITSSLYFEDKLAGQLEGEFAALIIPDTGEASSSSLDH